MKILLSILSLILLLKPGIAQNRAIEIINETYCIGVVDCSPNTTVEVELPPNTVRWFYTVTATKSPQIAESVQANPTIFSIFPNIQTERNRKSKRKRKPEQIAPVYPGDGNCSVYLLKSEFDTEKFMIPGGTYFFHGEYSRKNIPSTGMVIDDPVLCKGTQYIGIENSRAFMEQFNIYVVLTVIAVREEDN
jgi:hypothetical protein